MNQSRKLHINVSSTNAYGRTYFLGFQPIQPVKKSRVVHVKETRSVTSIGRELEIEVFGKMCPIVTTERDVYIVRLPNMTYGKFDIKTRAFLGAY